MNNVSLKKRLIPWIPYVLIGLFATNLGEAWRLASGTDASQKLLGLQAGFDLRGCDAPQKATGTRLQPGQPDR